VLSAARRKRLLNSVARVGACLGAAALLVLAASASLQDAVAEGDTRTLTFHHLHTGENITVTFKRDGRYDEAALQKLDWFMRDWRKGQSTHMDPQLFDILWEVYREVGASQPIEVVCGYRSPATNAMLRARSRSSGVAEFSQHTLGHAMDFYIPGVSLEKLREIGLRLQAGGVGFYPTSGSPFVHMDTGTIRHWPRMTYAQLSRVFPDGKTVHVAADGRPMPRFAQALAEVEARGKAPNHVALEQARAHGVITEQQVQTAELIAQSPRKPQQPSLLAALFGARESDRDVTASLPVTAKTPRVQVAGVEPDKVRPAERVLPPSSGRPKTANSALAQTAAPSPVSANVMALASPEGLSARGALVKELLPFEVASTEVPVQGALAYAYAPSDGFAPVRGQNWGVETERGSPPPAPAPIVQRSEPAQTTIVGKSGVAEATPNAVVPSDNPWLRAAILTPSVSGELTVTHFGTSDPVSYRPLFYKPAQAVAMSFADISPLLADRFTGPAIVFLATTTFTRAQTAALVLPESR